MKRFQNKKFTLVETSGQFVLLDKRRGHYWQLNAVGALIYERTLKGDSIDSIVEAILEKYDIDRENATKDVETLVSEFRNKEVI